MRLPMPVEVKLRPIHEDMLEVAQLFQKRHFARWIVGTVADFYGPIYGSNLHISCGPPFVSRFTQSPPRSQSHGPIRPAASGLVREGRSARMFGECVSAGMCRCP